MTPTGNESVRTLIDDYLADQRRLQTPVARFAETHGTSASHAPVYRDLIPLSRPGPGEQYAFQVDLDACTGCKACVAGCHSLNGLDEDETWRDVGMLIGGPVTSPYQQTVTTACHHCADPACLNGCPVLAYEKDDITGIVRHLDDQCIGCQYCVLKCPYDVPKYNQRLGIVRKCDLCQQRLAADEAPACVQACPTQAISIVTVSRWQNSAAAPDTGAFLPQAPDPGYTQPTTRYVSKRPIPANARPADADALRPQSAHAPLVVMLTLLSGAVGLSVLGCVVPPARSTATAGAAVLGLIGLGASVFHLGQPTRAWRIFLGWRRSWLSREALVFGAWFPFAVGAALLTRSSYSDTGLAHATLVVSAGLGLAGLTCSACIYVDTRRQAWRASQTFPRFFGSGLVISLAGLAAGMNQPYLALAAACGALAKLLIEAGQLLVAPRSSISRRLLLGPLSTGLAWRNGVTAAGSLILALATATSEAGEPLAWLGAITLLVGEGLERALYFQSVDAPKMPGMISP